MTIRPSFSARVRRSPPHRICATAEAGGFRSDIACLRTGRDRNDPSGSYADTHSLAGSRWASQGQADKDLDRALFVKRDQTDFLEFCRNDVLVERLHDVLVGAGMQRKRDMIHA